MKYELWHSASEGSYMLFLEGNRSKEQFKAPDARVVWTVEASSYNEALQRRNEFLERPGVTPAPDRDGVVRKPGHLLGRGAPNPDGRAGLPSDRPTTRGMSFDIFISHAIEDKDAFVRPLAEELVRLGYEVSFDARTLQVGDSLRASLDKALEDCDFGVVVLSPSFLAMDWAQHELDTLNQRETVSGRNVILPILHQVTLKELGRCSATLASRFAMESSTIVSDVALQVHGVLTDYRGHCGGCGRPLPKSSYFEAPGPAAGYTCPRCEFMDVWGFLTCE